MDALLDGPAPLRRSQEQQPESNRPLSIHPLQRNMRVACAYLCFSPLHCSNAAPGVGTASVALGCAVTAVEAKQLAKLLLNRLSSFLNLLHRFSSTSPAWSIWSESALSRVYSIFAVFPSTAEGRRVPLALLRPAMVVPSCQVSATGIYCPGHCWARRLCHCLVVVVWSGACWGQLLGAFTSCMATTRCYRCLIASRQHSVGRRLRRPRSLELLWIVWTRRRRKSGHVLSRAG